MSFLFLIFVCYLFLCSPKYNYLISHKIRSFILHILLNTIEKLFLYLLPLNPNFPFNIIFSCFRIMRSYSQKFLTTWTSRTIPLYKNLTICASFITIFIVATAVRFFGSINCTNIPA